MREYTQVKNLTSVAFVRRHLLQRKTIRTMKEFILEKDPILASYVIAHLRSSIIKFDMKDLTQVFNLMPVAFVRKDLQ